PPACVSRWNQSCAWRAGARSKAARRRARVGRWLVIASGRLVSGPPGRGPVCIVFRPSSVSIEEIEPGTLWILWLFVVKRVFHCYVISGRQGAEVVDALEGVEGGGVEGGRSTLGFDANVLRGAAAVDIKEDSDAFALGGGGVGLLGVPLLGDRVADNLEVVGIAVAEG